MLPFVVAGGLLIAMDFAFGAWQFGDQGIYIYEAEFTGRIGQALFNTGKAAFLYSSRCLAAILPIPLPDELQLPLAW